ncbi:hypothetical protein SSX86_023695 [Deinandra increscens subsp. villosa]|uniref:Uncharacterized protein n=1 Tax=Deinandra increscens subsp. villosa TaxID=3103831 RepID=A0AAP0CMR9_9ASTR
MADAAVSALVKEVMGRLASLAIQEFGLLWGFKKDISSLEDDFKQIEAVLEDAQEKRIKEKEVDLWLTSLRSACMEIENVLDEISTEALLQRLNKQRVTKHMVRSFIYFDHNPLMFRIRIAHKVKNIRRKLDAIKSRRSELGLKLTPGDVGLVDVVEDASEMPTRETSSLIHDSLLIVGRNEELQMVMETICNKDVGKHEIGEIRVYGIWGMGGVGKSTLAQYLPLGIKELTSLRIKLSYFHVGKEIGAEIGELGELNLLSEKLKIFGLENVGGLSDAKSANLKCKRNLVDLSLYWSAMSPYAEEVLEGLDPNPGIERIENSAIHGKDYFFNLDCQFKQFG